MGELEIKQFDYNQLDTSTAEFLKQKERNMREIVGNAYTQLGKELKEAQERLAGKNQYDGVFEKWYMALGFKKDTVYRLIQRYELVLANCENQKLIEELPVSLTYEIAKPSADEELKQKVLAGEIKTLKEYKELLKAKQEAERKAEIEEEKARELQRQKELLERQYEQARRYAQEVEEKYKEKMFEKPREIVREVIKEVPKEVVKEVVKEVIPEDYEALKKKVEELERVSKKYKELAEEKADVKLEALNRFRFKNAIREMIRVLNKSITEATIYLNETDEEEMQAEGEKAINELQKAIETIESWMNKREEGGYIYADYSIQS
ncbi:hypothetical protein [Caloramator australicus]|uniref:Uncharacterized protein n=1 Tax=Caloramator australicus RC3 TaxID=857293 RepID=I7J4Q0_9CLOT|nr:hypothetical protein [Caloramator australicus]CCJ32851.1 hypothetical protein CAAU_0767 [Caloramator australicus RC3]